MVRGSLKVAMFGAEPYLCKEETRTSYWPNALNMQRVSQLPSDERSIVIAGSMDRRNTLAKSLSWCLIL